MTSLCLYFKVHQPLQLKHFSPSDPDEFLPKSEEGGDRASVNRIGNPCYLPARVMARDGFDFRLPSELIQTRGDRPVHEVPDTISWEDKSLASCIWCGNMMQNNTLKKVYHMERMVIKYGTEDDMATRGHLQAADFFYYMADEHGKGESYK
jgi:hypothetical protein